MSELRLYSIPDYNPEGSSGDDIVPSGSTAEKSTSNATQPTPQSGITREEVQAMIAAAQLTQDVGQQKLVSGMIQSANFVKGSQGWQLLPNGDIEGNSGTFRGTITATTGTIGGFTIGTTTITSTGLTLTSGTSASLAFGTTPPTSPTAGTGIYIDKTGIFGLSSNTQNIKIDATNGKITITGGTIQTTAVISSLLVVTQFGGTMAAISNAVQVGNAGTMSIMRLADGVTGETAASFVVPGSATSISLMRLLYVRTGTGNLRLTFATQHYVSAGLPATLETDETDTETSYSGVANDSKIGAITIPAGAYNGLTSLVAGDTIGVFVARNGASASDTYNTQFDIVGIEVTFA